MALERYCPAFLEREGYIINLMSLNSSLFVLEDID